MKGLIENILIFLSRPSFLFPTYFSHLIMISDRGLQFIGKETSVVYIKKTGDGEMWEV